MKDNFFNKHKVVCKFLSKKNGILVYPRIEDYFFNFICTVPYISFRYFNFLFDFIEAHNVSAVRI